MPNVHEPRARRKTRGDDGRAHARAFGRGLGDFDHVAVRLQDGRGQPARAERDPEAIELGLLVRAPDGRAEVIVERACREAARDFARTVAARAVRHGVEVELAAHEHHVLVAGPTSPHIGEPEGAEHEILGHLVVAF